MEAPPNLKEVQNHFCHLLLVGVTTRRTEEGIYLLLKFGCKLDLAPVVPLSSFIPLVCSSALKFLFSITTSVQSDEPFSNAEQPYWCSPRSSDGYSISCCYHFWIEKKIHHRLNNVNQRKIFTSCTAFTFAEADQ